MRASNTFRQKILDEDLHDGEQLQGAYKDAGVAKYGNDTTHSEDVKRVL